ncbi:MAG: hypothetical protein ABH843_04535 [Candidatus Omnitrophota bacterium]
MEDSENLSKLGWKMADVGFISQDPDPILNDILLYQRTMKRGELPFRMHYIEADYFDISFLGTKMDHVDVILKMIDIGDITQGNDTVLLKELEFLKEHGYDMSAADVVTKLVVKGIIKERDDPLLVKTEERVRNFRNHIFWARLIIAKYIGGMIVREEAMAQFKTAFEKVVLTNRDGVSSDCIYTLLDAYKNGLVLDKADPILKPVQQKLERIKTLLSLPERVGERVEVRKRLMRLYLLLQYINKKQKIEDVLWYEYKYIFAMLDSEYITKADAVDCLTKLLKHLKGKHDTYCTNIIKLMLAKGLIDSSDHIILTDMLQHLAGMEAWNFYSDIVFEMVDQGLIKQKNNPALLIALERLLENGYWYRYARLIMKTVEKGLVTIDLSILQQQKRSTILQRSFPFSYWVDPVKEISVTLGIDAAV